MKRAAILVRVSTSRQDYLSQIEVLQGLVKNMGYSVHPDDIYAEKVTGRKEKLEDRIQLDRLMNDLITQNKRFEMIFISEVSRLSRNPKLGREIYEALTDLKVPMFISSLNIATIETNGARSVGASIAFQVSLENANSELKLIADRMQRGKLQAAKTGRSTGRLFEAYGYNKNAMKVLEIDPFESKVVKRIFQEIINGHGVKIIANLLNAEGIPTKSAIMSMIEVPDDGKERKPIKPKPWSGEAVIQLVKRTLYKGLRKYKVQKEDIENGIPAQFDYFPFPAIVTDDVWDRANAVLNSRSTRPRNVRWLYLLDGKAKCGRCGKGYHAKYRAGGRVSYYMCYNRKFSKQKCENAGLGISELESAVWSMIVASKTVYENLIDSYPVGEGTKQIGILVKEKSALERSIEEKKLQMQRSTRAWIKGRISEEENDLELEKVEKSIKNIRIKIATINQRISVIKDRQTDIISIDEWIDQVETAHEDRFVVASIMPNSVEKVIITSINSTGKPPRFFLITVFFTRVDRPLTRLFDKKTLIGYYGTGEIEIKYDDDNILINDAEEVYHNYIQKRSSKPAYKIPFKPLNILESKK